MHTTSLIPLNAKKPGGVRPTERAGQSTGPPQPIQRQEFSAIELKPHITSVVELEIVKDKADKEDQEGLAVQVKW